MKTYADGELILEPLQVEVKVGLGHLLLSPASELSENSRRHVDDEAVGAVQQGQEGSPDVLLALRCVIQEDLNTRAILLKTSHNKKNYGSGCFQLCKQLTVKRSSIITSRYWMVVSLDT